jgi:3-hydroxyanthranilate 3,4-dioxygenase
MAESLTAFNLKRWIDEHRHLLKPPVGAEMIWKESQFRVLIIGGPNARRDFHINPGDEFFYQLEGDMILEYIDEAGKRRRPTICEGDVFLLPAGTPHSSQRPAQTVGLVVERVRRQDESEGYAWYCERCDSKLYELSGREDDILADLKNVNEQFNATDALRTCLKWVTSTEATGPRL